MCNEEKPHPFSLRSLSLSSPHPALSPPVSLAAPPFSSPHLAGGTRCFLSLSPQTRTQTHRRTDAQTDTHRHTDTRTQTHGHTDTDTHGHTRHTERHTETHRHTDTRSPFPRAHL
eukprot:1265871-Rhodomonas_salina.2